MSIQLTLCLVALLSIGGTFARQVNITYLDNCPGAGANGDATVYVTDVNYHFMEDGTCDIVHSMIHITTVDTEPIALEMTLYKCPGLNLNGPCLESPTVHEELLDCDRLMNDDSGPWHMLTSAMDDGQCGDKTGSFPMNFARFKLEYLMKYLDVYDANFNTFRLKMNFKSTLTNTLRGCGELDFTLT